MPNQRVKLSWDHSLVLKIVREDFKIQLIKQ